MKYKQITIKPTLSKEWYVNIYSDGIERIKKKQKPSALGFYHCFETVSDEDAVNELIDCMIDSHQKEISDINKSMNELKKLRR